MQFYIVLSIVAILWLHLSDALALPVYQPNEREPQGTLVERVNIGKLYFFSLRCLLWCFLFKIGLHLSGISLQRRLMLLRLRNMDFQNTITFQNLTTDVLVTRYCEHVPKRPNSQKDLYALRTGYVMEPREPRVLGKQGSWGANEHRGSI
jgi:hypothetical protein